LNVFLGIAQLREFAGVELARHAAVENRQGTRANIFGELEIFIEAEPEGLEIVGRGPVVEFIIPAVDDGLTFGNVADCGLPAIAIHQPSLLLRPRGNG
jgi:hypothetical protein